MKRIFIHNPFFRLCAPPVLGLLVYLLVLLVNNDVKEIEKIFNNEELYICIGLSYLSLEVLRLSIVVLNRWIAREISYERKIIAQTITSALLSVLIVGAGVSAFFYWVAGYSIAMSELQIFLWIFGIIALLYNLLYFSNDYLFRENTVKVDQENRMREKLEADFVAFKNEINPDLLYESLETLIETLHHDVNAAEEQIDYLAGLYRYQVMNRNKELVKLEEELHVLNLLLKLLNHKHRNLIQHYTDLPNRDFYLIPGSLVVTVDSVIRNTIIAEQNSLTLRLYTEEDDYLVLQYRRNDRLVVHQSSLQAFRHLQRAYLFFSERPFVQVKADRENYIKFPLVSVVEEQTEAGA